MLSASLCQFALPINQGGRTNTELLLMRFIASLFHLVHKSPQETTNRKETDDKKQLCRVCWMRKALRRYWWWSTVTQCTQHVGKQSARHKNWFTGTIYTFHRRANMVQSYLHLPRTGSSPNTDFSPDEQTQYVTSKLPHITQQKIHHLVVELFNPGV